MSQIYDPSNPLFPRDTAFGQTMGTHTPSTEPFFSRICLWFSQGFPWIFSRISLDLSRISLAFFKDFFGQTIGRAHTGLRLAHRHFSQGFPPQMAFPPLSPSTYKPGREAFQRRIFAIYCHKTKRPLVKDLNAVFVPNLLLVFFLYWISELLNFLFDQSCILNFQCVNIRRGERKLSVCFFRDCVLALLPQIHFYLLFVWVISDDGVYLYPLLIFQLSSVSTSRGNIGVCRRRELILVAVRLFVISLPFNWPPIRRGPHPPYLGLSSQTIWVITVNRVVQVWIEKLWKKTSLPLF